MSDEPRRLRQRTPAAFGVALGLLALFVAAGCGRKTLGATSAQDAVALFLHRLAAADYEAAADLVAWGEMARTSNPDWDSLPPSQRKLILDKLRSQGMPALQALGAYVAAAGAEPTPQPSEAPTVFLIQGTGQPLVIEAVETQDGWQVLLPDWSF